MQVVPLSIVRSRPPPTGPPRIIDVDLWDRVQAILNDPERTNRRSTPKRHYKLRGRLRCGLCNSAMVGQTLTSKGRNYPYYRCRHAYTKNTARRCAARYIPAEAPEDEIWAEVRKVLTAPEVVLRELQQPREADAHVDERYRLDSEVASLREREERLVELFGLGEVDSEVVRSQLRDVQRRREVLAEQLAALSGPTVDVGADIEEESLRRTCAAIAERLDSGGREQHELVFEAVQLSVAATREEVTVEGVLPIKPLKSPKSAQNGAKVITTARTWA